MVFSSGRGPAQCEGMDRQRVLSYDSLHMQWNSSVGPLMCPLSPQRNTYATEHSFQVLTRPLSTSPIRARSVSH